MHPTQMTPERILPHRGRMLLIEGILHVDDHRAVTRSVVSAGWPFFTGRDVQALVAIELVAQTAGVLNGWFREKKYGPESDKRGWIVGIRQARLTVDILPLGTELISQAENRMAFEDFREIYGTVVHQQKTVGEITLQLLRADIGE